MTMKESTPKCPKCSRAILGDDVNAAKDIAYCRACNLAHRLSVLINTCELTHGVEVNNPPPGVRCDVSGGSLSVAVTHRALGAAVGTLAIALFWNGIVSIFVLIAIAGTLKNLHVPVPAWFPSPDMNGSPMSAGMTIFLWIFLTPFIVIGSGRIGAFLLTAVGRTEVQVDRNGSSVFTGIGLLGYRRRFMASEVSDVRIDERQWRDSDGDSQRRTCIVIETRSGRIIRFGSMLTAERRKFMAAVLRRALVQS